MVTSLVKHGAHSSDAGVPSRHLYCDAIHGDNPKQADEARHGETAADATVSCTRRAPRPPAWRRAGVSVETRRSWPLRVVSTVALSAATLPLSPSTVSWRGQLL